MQTGAYVSAAIMQMFPNGVRPGRARAAGVGAVAECGVWWLSLWRLAQGKRRRGGRTMHMKDSRRKRLELLSMERQPRRARPNVSEKGRGDGAHTIS